MKEVKTFGDLEVGDNIYELDFNVELVSIRPIYLIKEKESSKYKNLIKFGCSVVGGVDSVSMELVFNKDRFWDSQSGFIYLSSNEFEWLFNRIIEEKIQVQLQKFNSIFGYGFRLKDKD